LQAVQVDATGKISCIKWNLVIPRPHLAVHEIAHDLAEGVEDGLSGWDPKRFLPEMGPSL
jgi:hypothetical protein